MKEKQTKAYKQGYATSKANGDFINPYPKEPYPSNYHQWEQGYADHFNEEMDKQDEEINNPKS